mmetsp:Transcript_78425/g.239929  ORF Transcript_78425/g.239929 Transcript_78425/m.239929 type:complete len:246 (+) Transcript_78425:306-1043(+)
MGGHQGFRRVHEPLDDVVRDVAGPSRRLLCRVRQLSVLELESTHIGRGLQAEPGRVWEEFRDDDITERRLPRGRLQPRAKEGSGGERQRGDASVAREGHKGARGQLRLRARRSLGGQPGVGAHGGAVGGCRAGHHAGEGHGRGRSQLGRRDHCGGELQRQAHAADAAEAAEENGLRHGFLYPRHVAGRGHDRGGWLRGWQCGVGPRRGLGHERGGRGGHCWRQGGRAQRVAGAEAPGGLAGGGQL